MICPRCGAANGVDVPHGPDQEGSHRLALAQQMAKRVLCDACAQIVDHEDSQARKHERQLMHRRRMQMLPKSLHTATFKASPAGAEAIDAAKLWVAEGGTLTLTGSVGTGKTCLAAVAASHLMWERDVIWQSVPSMLSNAIAAPSEDDRKTALRAILGSGALVLDDLDKIKPAEWASSQVFAAIDNRVSNGAPLLVTLNKSIGELAAFIGGDFGPAIASRLAEQHVVQLTGNDQRLIAAGGG